MTAPKPRPIDAEPRRSLAQHAAIGVVRAYQYTLSPMIGPCCRYAPTCSHYACEAIERHGVLEGAALSLWRILRCNPWGGSGDDPVPAIPLSEALRARFFTGRRQRETS